MPFLPVYVVQQQCPVATCSEGLKERQEQTKQLHSLFQKHTRRPRTFSTKRT